MVLWDEIGLCRKKNPSSEKIAFFAPRIDMWIDYRKARKTHIDRPC
jgi:hypothetical protein